MASTSEQKRGRRARKPPGMQGAPSTWTPDALMTALAQGTTEEKLALLKQVGILDDSGKLAAKYKSWGSVVTRTAELDEETA